MNEPDPKLYHVILPCKSAIDREASHDMEVIKFNDYGTYFIVLLIRYSIVLLITYSIVLLITYSIVLFITYFIVLLIRYSIVLVYYVFYCTGHYTLYV